MQAYAPGCGAELCNKYDTMLTSLIFDGFNMIDVVLSQKVLNSADLVVIKIAASKPQPNLPRWCWTSCSTLVTLVLVYVGVSNHVGGRPRCQKGQLINTDFSRLDLKR